MLRIAVPNKGSLADASATMLREAGYSQRADSRALVMIDEANSVEFFYLRPRDIAVYVGEGTLDLGITGRDLLLDSQAAADERLSLGFGGSKFYFAAPPGRFGEVRDLEGARVATSYAGVLEDYFYDAGVAAQVVRLDGAVESAIRLGVADAIADVVSTGTTLRQAGLKLFGDPILESEAVLIGRRGVDDPAGMDVLVRRLRGVMVARTYVMMDYDIRSDLVDDACRITPGIESPTVSPLQASGWSAVRSMVPTSQAQSIMDQLYDLGARGILVTSISACRV